MISAVETQQFVHTQTAKLFSDANPLVLECGKTLSQVDIAFETYGALNTERTNAVLICHALTANAHAAGVQSEGDKKGGWWSGLIGPGKAFDTNRYFIVSPNILGSCYGTTGPASLNPRTGLAYRMSFPQITVRDIVAVQRELLKYLGVERLVTVSGSSLGGMQVVEWGIMYPGFCESIIPISTAARQPAWCIGLNVAARKAITNDPAWNGGNYTQQPASGLTLARMIGMISYRSPEEFEGRFGQLRKSEYGNPFDSGNPFEVESYLRYQGEKLVERFDANTYLYLSHAMDLHDVGRNRGLVSEVLRRVRTRTLVVGFSSDVRYPTMFQRELASSIPGARYAEIPSIHGHDAFLIEFDALNRLIHGFLPKG